MIRRMGLRPHPAVKGNAPDLAPGMKHVPSEATLRETLRREARRLLTHLDRREPIAHDNLVTLAGSLLEESGAPGNFLGFAMVTLNNEFWRDQLAAIPFDRRLLLLPHCLRRPDTCKGSYSAAGLTCSHCGACPISNLVNQAGSLGYKVLVAEGTPAVLDVILDGLADAVIGVACLDSLEKAFKRIVVLGVPHAAVPLLVDGCVHTAADLDDVRSWVHLRTPASVQRTHTYVPLLQAAQEMFRPGVLDALLAPEIDTLIPNPDSRILNPESRIPNPESLLDPMTGTQQIALDWLRVGGKRFRPFVTLAAYASQTSGPASFTLHADLSDAFPDSVRRAAVAVEALHKASLVHDDIEDDDAFRYGRRTLHRQYGPATAVNVGDYLVGLGYRLIAAGRDELSPQAVTDMLQAVSRAHMKLSIGQGSELLWRDRDPRELRPLDLLHIYSLKTAPAFEAAMLIGLRAAGPVEPFLQPVRACCRYLGVAYQVLNDLKDWNGDADKLVAGQDLLGRRPTILQAFAMEAGSPQSNREILDLIRSSVPPDQVLQRLRAVYHERKVFDKAHALVDKYRQRARASAAGIEQAALRELLHFIVDIVLS